MQKIPTLFVRDMETRLVTPVVTPGCEWVIDGVGVATVKFDGTCCLVRDGRLYKRYDAKKGRTPPANWEPAQEKPDPITGHWPGWLPVGDGPEDKYHQEAWRNAANLEQLFRMTTRDGTWELVGPRIQGDPYGLLVHQLWRHGSVALYTVPTDFEGLRDWLSAHEIEGIVWHHDDGRMAKLKRKDFGLPWPVRDGGQDD